MIICSHKEVQPCTTYAGSFRLQEIWLIAACRRGWRQTNKLSTTPSSGRSDQNAGYVGKGTKISAKSQQPVPQIHVDLGILCFLWGRRWRQRQQIAAQLIELRNDFLQQKLMHRRSDAPGGKEHVGATSGSPWSSLKLGLKKYPPI